MSCLPNRLSLKLALCSSISGLILCKTNLIYCVLGKRSEVIDC